MLITEEAAYRRKRNSRYGTCISTLERNHTVPPPLIKVEAPLLTVCKHDLLAGPKKYSTLSIPSTGLSIVLLNYSTANLRQLWWGYVLTDTFPSCQCDDHIISYLSHAAINCYQVSSFPISQPAVHTCSKGDKWHAKLRENALYSFCHLPNGLHPVCHISDISVVALVLNSWCLASGKQFSGKQKLSEACNYVHLRPTTSGSVWRMPMDREQGMCGLQFPVLMQQQAAARLPQGLLSTGYSRV